MLLVWTFAIQSYFHDKLYFTGDEPSYLLATVSVLEDGDFNLGNNYYKHDYLKFGYEGLMLPQWVRQNGPLDKTFVPAEHGTALPLLIAPAYRLGNVEGVRKFLIALSFLAALLAGAAADWLTGSRWAGSFAIALTALAPAWQMHASRVYPDMPAALLAGIIMLLLARYAAYPERGAGGVSAFVIGFAVCLLPVLYVKYGMLAAPLGLTALWIEAFRRNKAIYIGGASALGLGAISAAMFGSQGVLGGGLGIGADPFARAHAHLLTTDHSFGRYWAQWFDSHHGLAIYEPYMLLAIWAAIAFLRFAETPKTKVLAGFSAAFAAFTAMHAFWNTGPGWSYPGRYVAAGVPLMSVLVVCWAARPSKLRKLRIAVIGAGSAISIAFFVASVSQRFTPEVVLRDYTRLFPFYWSSWSSGVDFQPVTDFGLLPVYATLAIVLTKCLGLLLERRNQAPES